MEQRYLEESVVDMIGRYSKTFWKLVVDMQKSIRCRYCQINLMLVQIDYKFILSSIAACQWERCLGGSEEATVDDLVRCEDKYLERYLPSDREKVKMIQKKLEQKYS